ncbi:hypothetical protein [Phytobacter diazotrophicus]|uniref:hypothetical protein n=1 Tax=Phytobacter diazotrophicus TaxID=395631 RepID=UPI002FFA2E86
MKKILIVLLGSILLTACAAKVDPAVQAEAKKPLICKDEKQCDLYWKRAQFWIAHNSAWKIQTATDTLISTFNPPGSDARLAYQVTKMPNEDGSARIYIAPFCNNMFGCQPELYGAVVNFKNFVKSGS